MRSLDAPHARDEARARRVLLAAGDALLAVGLALDGERHHRRAPCAGLRETEERVSAEHGEKHAAERAPGA